MNPEISGKTQATLLLTAPLMAGEPSTDLLHSTEYLWLLRHLRGTSHTIMDLVSTDAGELIESCWPAIDPNRLRRLVGRGFLLSQFIEHWQARSIWVLGHSDPDYPQRLKPRLGEYCPAILYGCGDVGILQQDGLAVVGSRKIDENIAGYAMDAGRLAAQEGATLVSGGARGVDQAAMRGALKSGGNVCGVLAHGLGEAVLDREYRDALLSGRLVLVSPFDPASGFNVGNAMGRNKVIYALAQASLVINSDFGRGGTWAGAVEQLDKLKIGPVYVRSTGAPCVGLEELRIKGALPWPNPVGKAQFQAALAGVKYTPEPRNEAQNMKKMLGPETIEILNVHVHGQTGISVMRPSTLGNPYKVGNPHTRDQACDLYEAWLKTASKSDQNVRKALSILWQAWHREGKLQLRCCCAPKRCHAESIKALLLEKEGELR